jgi:hypothetical protein
MAPAKVLENCRGAVLPPVPGVPPPGPVVRPAGAVPVIEFWAGTVVVVSLPMRPVTNRLRLSSAVWARCRAIISGEPPIVDVPAGIGTEACGCDWCECCGACVP